MQKLFDKIGKAVDDALDIGEKKIKELKEDMDNLVDEKTASAALPRIRRMSSECGKCICCGAEFSDSDEDTRP